MESSQKLLLLEKALAAKRTKLCRESLRSYFAIAQDWQLNQTESFKVLQLSPLHQMAYWRNNADDIALTDDQLERICHLLVLHYVLSLNFFEAEEIIKWLRGFHHEKAFLEKTTPLDFLKHATLEETKHFVDQMILSP